MNRFTRAGLASVLGLTLVVGVIAPAGAAPPPVKDEPLVKAAKVKSVGGKDYKPIPRKPDLNVDVVKTPAVSWPAAGTAEVAVPQPTWASTLSGVMPKQAAGNLPVSVGPAKADGTAPSSVKVDLLGRQGSSLLVKLTSKDKAAGKVALELNYEPFRYAHGGDWATRLQLVEASTGKPIPTRNTGSGKLSAEVSANGLYAMEAAANGPAGDFGATSLAPSASWSVGGSSGDFNWQYPFRTPPGTGGPTPTINLGYSSGSVDGRTTSTNNQTSWAGEGFDLAPGGAIERRYTSCASKSEKTGNNGTRIVGDLCFATDNATFSLNGRGGELVRDDQTGEWRPKSDDGTKVEKLFGATNGDEGHNAATTGEYWRITGKDGIQYYFGLNKIPSPNAVDTSSTWTVPVAGNHAGEQCHQAAFASSFCQQAYRWNLDYVVDPHGNTMSLFYETEKNNYAYNGTETTVKSYDRAGNIKRIDYGQTAGQVFSEKPVARVHFDTTQRCAAGINCAPADFLDTPTDQECTSTTRCTKLGPSFFTKKKLSKVRTEVLRGTVFDTVDTYTLRHSFPNPADNTSPRLWLEAITHAGEVGTGAVSMPEVNFDKVQLNNRVADGSGQSVLDWFRISAIHYGTGGELSIAYAGKDCSLPGNVPPVDDNHRRCYPVKWTPPGAVDEREDWFHKYVVSSVTESDRVTGMVPVMTTVTYPEGPSWRHDDEDGLVEIGKKTWSQWRGYERVVVTKGHPSGTQSVTEHRYFQGMDGDKKKGTTEVKDVKIEDSTGVAVDDLNTLAGQERETSKLVNGAIAERTITDSWVSPATSTRVRDWGTTQAFQVEQKAVRQWTAKPGGGFQETAASNEYSSTGVLTASSNANDLATTADDTCTRYEYASNATKGIAEIPTRTHMVAKACNQPWTKEDVVSDEKQAYSGGTAPVHAKPTVVQRLSGFTSAGAPTYQTVKTTEYDDHGRKKLETDAKNQPTRYEYFPADGPVTKTTATLSNGHTTSTELDPAWGQPVKVTDVGNRVTVSQRDPMGRISKVWLPGRALSATPNVEHTYYAGVDQPNVVQSKHLQSDGTVETRYEILDGLQRKRQLQQPSADGIGRVITDIEYDSRGLQIIANNPYYNEAAPGIVAYDPVEEELAARKATEFDELERPRKEAFWSLNEEKWFTTHTHEPDRQTVNPPTGEQATTKISDARGRPVELRTYNTADPSTDYGKTSYTYTKAGQLASVTDPAGNVWRYSYDVMGRRTKIEEPDRGTSTYTYNELDQVTSTTDARGTKLFYTYDAAGRPLTTREGTETGPLRVERTYDTLATGSPSTATRWVNGNAYKTEVTGYDPGGQPLGTKVTLPASEGALARTYEISTTYTQTGQQKTLTVPGVGGLPAETLTTTYDGNEVPKTLSSELGSYVTDTEFNSFGDLTMLEVKPSNGKWLRHSYVYDDATRRLNRAIVQRETTGPQRVLDQSYSYDHAGNVTKIVDAPASGSTDPVDTQCFNYDESRRLTQAWTPSSGSCTVQPTSATQLGGPAPYWHQWTFDAIGNRKTEKRNTTAGVTTSTYEYPATGSPQPHGVRKVTTTGPGGTKVNEYGYDASGNQTSRSVAGVAETFDFDAEGKLAKVTKGDKKTEFVYDADGNRLLRRDHTGTTLYLGSTELLLMPDGSQLGTRHYTFGKQTIGVRVGTKLTWLGSDHHGSATLTVDAETQAYQRKRITPYGEARGAVPTAWPGQKDFVGGTRDDSTGLVSLGAREYDPTTGRFISVDPVVDPEDPQQLNGYAYANNSPVSFVDADGKRYRVETVTELKAVVRVHVKRIVELQKEVITVYVKIVIWTFVARLAGLFGMHNLAVKATAEVARQVTIWKQVVKTIRYHTREVIRIVTKRFIKLSGKDAAEMKNALALANNVEANLNNQDRQVDKLGKIAKDIGDRAQAALLAAAKNKGQNEEAAKNQAGEDREGAEDMGKNAGRAAGGIAGGAAGKALGGLGFACGPAAAGCIFVLGTAGSFVGTKLGGWLGGLWWDGMNRPNSCGRCELTQDEIDDINDKYAHKND